MRASAAGVEVAALIAAAMLAIPAQQEAAPGVRLLVERVQERYQEAPDMQARFVQRQLSRLGSVMQEVHGMLYIATPGRMRWEYAADGQLLVAGGPGREIYSYFPADNQVEVYETEVSEASDMPILYLAGQGNLRRDFDIEAVEWGAPLAPGNVQLELRPRRGEPSFERLIIEVEPFRATIVRLINFDKLRNVIEYQFHDVEFDVGLADDLFEFEIPAGADVILIGG
jgi:outer membrane lipoprotein-sorting protein